MKFYSSEPSINLQEEITRYQFVLQLKHDILKGILPASYETIIELSAQALQGTYYHIKSDGCEIILNFISKVEKIYEDLRNSFFVNSRTR